MTSITVRGDVERFCLGMDPTCTGINPCRACWESVRDHVMPAALRAANAGATEAQAISGVREHYMAWCSLLGSLHQQHPELFAQIIARREPALIQEMQEAQALGRKAPLTPFSNVAIQIPAPPTMQPPQAPQADSGAASPQPQPQASAMQAPEWPPDDLDGGPMGRGDVKRVVRNGKRYPKRKRPIAVMPNGRVELANGTNGVHNPDEGEEP